MFSERFLRKAIENSIFRVAVQYNLKHGLLNLAANEKKTRNKMIMAFVIALAVRD